MLKEFEKKYWIANNSSQNPYTYLLIVFVKFVFTSFLCPLVNITDWKKEFLTIVFSNRDATSLLSVTGFPRFLYLICLDQCRILDIVRYIAKIRICFFERLLFGSFAAESDWVEFNLSIWTYNGVKTMYRCIALTLLALLLTYDLNEYNVFTCLFCLNKFW